MPPTAPQTPAERFAGIIATLLAMVGARVQRPGTPGLAGPLTLAIAIRLQRIRHRITRFAARMAAGTLRPPRRRKAAPRRRTAPAKPPLIVLPKLPRGRLWLVRLVPGIGVGATYLRILLDDPEMQALLAAAPQMGRTLRPFWQMLSSDPLPPILQRPRPAAAPPAEPTPPRPAEADPAPPAGEANAARQRPLARLRERAGVRVVQPPQSRQAPNPAPEVAGTPRLRPATA